ncbi:MAG: hypothetical protein GWO86_00865 [Planctomycetes bacterium]|nr:hypothetical protein [Planctomycetota bacterium]
MSAAAGEIDKSRYITIDEISPGMKAYCKTVYKGVEIEKFALEVVDVIRDIRPGKNAILVIGTDERFIHTGPVQGCSGSPVYIDGRLAGALAFGWSFSKDALYGVTPIAEMLEVGTRENAGAQSSYSGVDFGLSDGIDLKKIYAKIISLPATEAAIPAGARILRSPLMTSLGGKTCEKMRPAFEPFGLVPISGVSAGGSSRLSEYKDMKLAPGGILAVPLVSGDITASAIGTVTEVVDDKVYGFGHSFLGRGQIDVPMATGYVHTVVANMVSSFKFGQAVDIKGSLQADESTAVFGRIGQKAKTIPMRISIERFNDIPREYNCQLAVNRYYTPLLTAFSISGTALMRGDLPTDHTIEYKSKINVRGYEPIYFENISTGSGLEEILTENVGILTYLMNNPYKKVKIKSLEFDLKISPRNTSSRIWSVDISDNTVRPGDEVNISVVLESYLAEKKRYDCSIKMPDDIEPGKYQLAVSGVFGYEAFLRQAAGWRFVPENLADSINIINDITNTRRDKLYFVLVQPPSGIAIERAELSDLPMSRIVLLDDAKRSLTVQPVAKWLEKDISVGTVVADKKLVEITIEKN